VDEQLPIAAFAFPGPLRDRLVGAVLAGAKTATSSLLAEYEGEGAEPLPVVGGRSLVVDSQERPVALIETTEVRVVMLADVDLAFARDEGEGFASIGEWREAHERFWRSPELRAALGREPELSDETPVVVERFRLLRRL
jgi:uncharacterized protein YhfF